MGNRTLAGHFGLEERRRLAAEDAFGPHMMTRDGLYHRTALRVDFLFCCFVSFSVVSGFFVRVRFSVSGFVLLFSFVRARRNRCLLWRCGSLVSLTV